YQSDQGLMGLAEGGWWGVGLGESRQKWGRLPAAQDDYIFAIIGEELGLIGTLGVLALFTVLALIMSRMITRLEDHFMQITVAGISAWLLGQAVVNMMVVTGLLPVIGVPLPFISSGGSALLASMTALGLLLSFARREPGAQEAISARFGSVRRSVSVQPAPRDSAPDGPQRHTPPPILLTAGGSAGPLPPLLATAAQIRRRSPESEIIVLGTAQGLETDLVPAAGLELVTIEKVPFPRRPNGAALRFPGRFAGTLKAVRTLLRERRIDVVAG